MKDIETASQYKSQSKIDTYVKKLKDRHRFITIFMIIVVGPLIALMAVMAAAYLIMLPVSLIMGWV